MSRCMLMRPAPSLPQGASVSTDGSGLGVADGDADVASEASMDVAREVSRPRWDLGPKLNSEFSGMRELPSPEWPIMYAREVSHGSGPISGVSVLLPCR